MLAAVTGHLNNTGTLGIEPSSAIVQPASFDLPRLKAKKRKAVRVRGMRKRIPPNLRQSFSSSPARLSSGRGPPVHATHYHDVAFVAGKFEPGDDRMFDPTEFEKIQTALGRKFTLEAAANADSSNSLVPDNYCSPARPFDQAQVAGHTVWCNPPFSQATEFLEHYCIEKQKDPARTSGCFVLPAWPMATFTRFLKGMSLVKQYPRGTRLFYAVNAETGEREKMAGVPWPINVWYDAPKLHTRAVQVRLSLLNAVQGQGDEASQDPSVRVELDYVMQFGGMFAGRPVKVLVDTGSTSSFISRDTLQQMEMPMDTSQRHSVGAFDGREVRTDGTVAGRLRLLGLRETLALHVISLAPHFDIVLGNDWVRSHRAVLDYDKRCMSVMSRDKRYSIPCEAFLPDAVGKAKSAIRVSQVTRVQAKRLVLRKRRQSYFVQVRLAPDTQPEQDPAAQSTHVTSLELGAPEQPPGSPILSGDGLVPSLELEALKAEFGDVLRDVPPGLPPEREVDHTIPLVEGAQPPRRRGFRMSPAERREVEKYIQELIQMGWVVPSTSPFNAPILFIPKPDGSLRVCLDYRALNALTVKNRYALPRSDDLIDSLAGATVFTALDLASGYWQIRLNPEDCPKTAFSTHFGHFEWRVLPMGLSNAPGTFQALMNRLFTGKGLGTFVAVYLDDILIYSRTPEEHLKHLRTVFEVLRESKLYCRPHKCHFNKSELKYLGHIVGSDGIKVDPAKIKVVTEWPVPVNPRDVRSFLGLATYFRRFIQGFASLAAPLHRLTHNDVSPREWPWTPECQRAFDELKRALTTAPVLALPDWEKPFEIVADASTHGTGAVLLQEGRPVAYESRKFTATEYRYDTGEREMLGVVRALTAFRCYVEGNRFTLVTDHEPLIFFEKQPRLSRKHARWYEFLQTFDMVWEHRPGRINVADPLSRVPELWAEEPVASSGLRCGAVLPRCVRPLPHICAVLGLRVTAAAQQPAASEGPVGGLDYQLDTYDSDEEPAAVRDRRRYSQGLPPFYAHVCEAYAADPLFSDAGACTEHGLTRERGFWWRGEALVIPNNAELRAQCLHKCHNSLYGGHFGTEKTVHLLERTYWWPTVAEDAARYVQECLTCQRNKPANYTPYGELQLHPIPEDTWESISLDLIVKLPKTKRGHDSILVTVDRLSKYAIFHACSEKMSSEELLNIVRQRVVGEKGFPRSIVGDRDGRIIAEAFQKWCQENDIECHLNTAYHSRANGQTERFNRTLEEYLRSFVSAEMDNWDTLLPDAQLAINNSWNSAIKATPYWLVHGRHPYIPGLTTFKRAGVTSAQEQKQCRAAWSSERKLAVQQAKKHMAAAQERMKREFNKRRQPKEFQVGQRVLLNVRNLHLKDVKCSKFGPKFIGPFTVEEKVGSVNYKLTLPETMRCHPVFHVELLREYKGNDFTFPPAIQCDDGQLRYEVERILRARRNGTRRQYLVQWKGLSSEFATWEPSAKLRLEIPDLLQEFDENNSQ